MQLLTLFCLKVLFRVKDTDSLDLGLGDKINFGVFEEQHLSKCYSLIWTSKTNSSHTELKLHHQFWYHIECYPLPGSIDEAEEHKILLRHLTFAMIGTSLILTLSHVTYTHLDVSTSRTSTSPYTASEYSDFIMSIEKTPENSRTWPIARIAGFMAENRFINYYGHPSARLNYQHAIEEEAALASDASAEQTEGASPASDASAKQTDGPAPASDTSAEQTEGAAPASNASAEQTEGVAPASAEQTPGQSIQRRRFGGLWLPSTTHWYTMIAIFLRLWSGFLFDSPIRHHTALEDLYVDKIVYQRKYTQIMKTLQDDWSDASLLATLLFT